MSAPQARGSRPRLGVNVDHVATLRQQRGTIYPDPVVAAALAELAGAEGVTVHLREDRRHIQERDVEILRSTVQTRLNLEMAATDAMVELACRIRPDIVTLVPEKREEKTTEGGLDVQRRIEPLRAAVSRLRAAGIRVSLFVEPDEGALRASREIGADTVELHTGAYCLARGVAQAREFETIRRAAEAAASGGFGVAAGHGLGYLDVRDVAAIAAIEELNIGHGIVARAVLVGFERAVREMISAIDEGARGRMERRPGPGQ